MLLTTTATTNVVIVLTCTVAASLALHQRSVVEEIGIPPSVLNARDNINGSDNQNALTGRSRFDGLIHNKNLSLKISQPHFEALPARAGALYGNGGGSWTPPASASAAVETPAPSAYGNGQSNTVGAGGGTTTAAVLGASCSSDADCAAVQSGGCINGLCTCPNATTQLTSTVCINTALNYGDDCVITNQCRALDARATCYASKCICEPLYYVAGMERPPNLATSSNAYDPLSVDVNSFQNGGQSSAAVCLRKAKLSEACCDTRQCMYSVGKKSRQYRAGNRLYFLPTLYKVWHSSCQPAPPTPYAPSSTTCQCDFNYVPVGHVACVPVAATFADPCAITPQCRNITGTECGASGSCECHLPEYCYADGVTAAALAALRANPPIVVTGGRKRRQTTTLTIPPICYPVQPLGAPCSQNNQCSNGTRNANCTNSICQCNANFLNLGNATCVPTALLGQACEIDDQCAVPTANAVCDENDTGTCVCRTGFHEDDNTGTTCVALSPFTMACTVASDCATKNAVCTGLICLCATGLVHTVSTDSCDTPTLQFSQGSYIFNPADTCCRTGDSSVARPVGQVAVAGSSTAIGATTVMYMIMPTNAQVIIDPITGELSLAAGVDLTAPLTVTVVASATSAGQPTITTSTSVTINPASCCVPPTATMTNPLQLTTTVTLSDAGRIQNKGGGIVEPNLDTDCVGLDLNIPLSDPVSQGGVAENAYDLFHVQDVLSQSCPADPIVTLTAVGPTIVISPTSPPTCYATDAGIVSFVDPSRMGSTPPYPTDFLAPMSLTCTITGTFTDCLGNVVPYALTATVNGCPLQPSPNLLAPG